MKKLLSFTLVFLLMLCIAVPAYATTAGISPENIVTGELIPFDEQKAELHAKAKLEELSKSISPRALVPTFYAFELDATPVVEKNGELYTIGLPTETQTSGGVLNPLFTRKYGGMWFENTLDGSIYPIDYYIVVYVREWDIVSHWGTFNDQNILGITSNGADTSYAYYGFHFLCRKDDSGLFRGYGTPRNGVTIQSPWTIH